MPAEVFLQQKGQPRNLHPGETVIVKVQIYERFPRVSGPEAIREALPEETGLATAAHTDHRQGLSGDGWQPDFPSRQVRQRCRQRIGQLLLQQDLKLFLHQG